MTQIAGIILRTPQKQITADFYSTLGLNLHEHSHGGPVHFECLDISSDFVAEMYQASPTFTRDALMIKVESIQNTLQKLNIAPKTEIKTVGDIKFTYIADPDGRDIMLIENN